VFSEKMIYRNQSWEITEFAVYKNFDLIIMGSRGMSRVKEAFLEVLQIMYFINLKFIYL